MVKKVEGPLAPPVSPPLPTEVNNQSLLLNYHFALLRSGDFTLVYQMGELEYIDALLISYRTSLEMFCDVKMYFSQLLKACVLTVDILGILFIK